MGYIKNKPHGKPKTEGPPVTVRQMDEKFYSGSADPILRFHMSSSTEEI
jgi:hypothetical protein